MNKKYLFEIWIATLVALLTVPMVYAYTHAEWSNFATPLAFALGLVLLYVTIRTWEWSKGLNVERNYWIVMVFVGAFLVVLCAALGTFLPTDPELDYSVRTAILLVFGLYGGIMTIVSSIWIGNAPR